jgi:hypothetical protein
VSESTATVIDQIITNMPVTEMSLSFLPFEFYLPVVLYGCETWSLTLREEHRLRVFENRLLRRIFGPKRNEVTGDWR